MQTNEQSLSQGQLQQEKQQQLLVVVVVVAVLLVMMLNSLGSLAPSVPTAMALMVLCRA